MNKLKEILVNQSQWIALGVGGLWLLFMIYTHVLASSTASVDVKGNELGPGSVDQFISENAINKLKDSMAGTGTLPPLNTDYLAVVKATIALNGESPVAYTLQEWARSSRIFSGSIRFSALNCAVTVSSLNALPLASL